jgi:ribosomal protein S18 acetylase RimI-like enzyme
MIMGVFGSMIFLQAIIFKYYHYKALRQQKVPSHTSLILQSWKIYYNVLVMADAEVRTIRKYDHPREFERRTEILDQFGMRNANRDTWEHMAIISTRDPESTLMADVGGLAIGTVMYEYSKGIGTISALAVDRAYQGQGHGSALLHEVENRLAQRGCPQSEVLVDDHKLGLIDFYKRRGYQLGYQCVGMTKPLSPESANNYDLNGLAVRYAIERIYNEHARPYNQQVPYQFESVSSLYTAIRNSDAPDLPRIGVLPKWLQRDDKARVWPTPWVAQGDHYQRWIPISTYTEDTMLRVEVVNGGAAYVALMIPLHPPGGTCLIIMNQKKHKYFSLKKTWIAGTDLWTVLAHLLSIRVQPL